MLQSDLETERKASRKKARNVLPDRLQRPKDSISQGAVGGWEVRRVGGVSPCPPASVRPALSGGAHRLYLLILKRIDWAAGRTGAGMESRPGPRYALGACCLLGLFYNPVLSSVLRSRSDGPIIGVLAQETDFKSFQKFGSSYIAASYVKFLESAGARVVPVRLNHSDHEYDKIFHSINGILYPGGGVSLKTSEFSRVAKIFYNKAIEAYERGDYFPVWGTCLGHQLLSYLTSGEDLLTWTNTDGFSFPLNFTEGAKGSRMFQDFPDSLLQSLATEPLTSNFHFWSLSVQNFTNNEKLHKFYKILTTNVHAGVEFISTMEASRYPFYGVQWHPEKNPFEWKNSTGIPHSRSAIRATYYIADFFVNEARKSNHRFPSKKSETDALIYNFNPLFTGRFSSFEQAYFFD
ncbi:gamma-glutamyl hydrolase [Hemicordylus capensis]|uniref:gamma-glutamyl hydrolase n=1 Tax=Hemicordylus capensis TaxID=884348 RepID=UPI0023023F94|nr:gamma-glutamyl hydrolase [Hemicordylus capensis]